MSELRFSWDPAKASANLRKHGVSFEEATSAFADDHALLIDDPAHSKDEERFVLMGLSARLRVIVVVHALRDAGHVIRLISARTATRREQRQYLEQQTP